MYSWIVGRLMRVLYGKLSAGDTALLTKTLAPDVQFVFPGESSFAGDHRGRLEVERWLERFVGLRPRFEILDVAAAGPPWNMRVCARFTDQIADPPYRNEGVEYLRIRWGRLRELRVYLDTQKVADLDRRLAASGSEAGSGEVPDRLAALGQPRRAAQ